MSVCLVDDTNILKEQKVVEKLLLKPISSFDRIGGGANSRVYRVKDNDSNQYAAKFYFTHESDSRDRLGTEFNSLSFFWKEGLRCIPNPIAMDQEHACAVYEYIDGEKIASEDVTEKDIDDVVKFLREVKSFTNRVDTKEFSLASEACFSVKQIIDNIQWRLERLKSSVNNNKELRDFLVDDFNPFLDELMQWGKQQFIDFDRKISQEERTLSLSDYGFHNAIRNKDGDIIFFDFEYFGWDDPAKMISDFLLHPAMDLSDELKKRFVLKIYEVFQNSLTLKKRVEIVYPLFGLKWCLIFLNEFVDGDLKRRNFAQGDSISKKQRQEVQLLKAKKMLNLMKETYQEFPYK